MKEELISFDTAKLAKEKGFDVELKTAYIGGKFFESEEEPNGYDGYYPSFTSDFNKNGWSYNREGLCSTQEPDNKKYFEACSAPTQSLLQRWLREVHGIHLVVGFDYDKKLYKPTIQRAEYYGPTAKVQYVYRNVGYTKEYKTYEQALEAGLLEALKMIK